MDDINPATLFWLTGLLEGEAYFGHGVPTEPNNPRINLSMTDEDVIARVATIFGHSYTRYQPKVVHWNATYKFTLRGARAAQLMRHIYPYMGLRRKSQIDRALQNFIYKPNANITTPKVTEAQVRAIKARLANGETAKSIAQDFPISHYAIWDIRSGKTWGHVSIDDKEAADSFQHLQLPVLEFTEENAFSWLVGLLEGEGSFMSGPPSSPNTPRISIAMTDEVVLARVGEICGTKYQSLRSRNAKHKNVFRIHVRGSKAIALMRQVYPFMGNRRQEQIDRVFNSYVEIPQNRGMYNPSAKINERQAREIKQRLLDGENMSSLAQEFNVSLSIVREIKLGRTWKHITV
jgi:hypothetical protein